MKLESLNEYVIFAKHMNFSKAAQELFISQPGLSTHISKLEKELGFTLVDRSGGRVSLTPAGTVFLQYAQKLLLTYNEGLEKCVVLSKKNPPLRIASVPIDSPMYRLLSREKDLSFVFVDIPFDTSIVSAIEGNLIDVGIGFEALGSEDSPINNLYSFEVITYDKAGICMMRSHPLARKQSLTKSDLNGLTVTINSGDHFDSWKKTILNMLGDDIELEFRLDIIGSVAGLSMIDLGDAIHICGQSALEDYFSKRDDIVIIDTIDGESLLFPIGVVWRSDRHSDQIDILIELLRTV